MTYYTFTANISEYSKNNLRAGLALLFVFFIIEFAFIERWLNSHPMSFYVVHLILIVILALSCIYTFKLKSIDGEYSLTLTSHYLTVSSPHPIIGDSFKIELKDLKKLVFLYSVDHETNQLNQTDRVFFIDTGKSKLLLPEFPGHNCEELFKIIKKVSPETSLLTRQIKLKESLALATRFFTVFILQNK